MVKLVTRIPRRVAGRDLKPGDEFEVDDKTGAALTQSGHAEAIVDKPPAPKPPPAADPPKTIEPSKAATEVKPLTTQAQQPQPASADYARRDLKAKE